MRSSGSAVVARHSGRKMFDAISCTGIIQCRELLHGRRENWYLGNKPRTRNRRIYNRFIFRDFYEIYFFEFQSLGCILYALCYFKSPFDAVYERGDSVALAVISANVTFNEDSPYNEVRIKIDWRIELAV